MKKKDIDLKNPDINSIERQLVRGNLFSHTSIGLHSERINEIESFLFGLIDLLLEKGNFNEVELKNTVKRVRNELLENGEYAHARVGIRKDNPDEKQANEPIHCNERIHICNAICCKLKFLLSIEEIEAGIIKWDLGHPYSIRHEENGFCSHLCTEKKTCNIYDSRPKACSNYSCVNDKRIWSDFDKMLLNNEWIKENLHVQKTQFQGGTMMQNPSNYK